ncbi:polysaccharide lyase 6 family protein [Streptomyces netropsis]|uniref:Poly(Beta-D-mannuronate) lyase n=1 Tax=Streptomyces netropsis TaxID=55404 RepID=A0A7W7PEJ3_STRNE|nr:polysaccharide lyase 6 family protein [Streptomyces netropsis]MBB4887901.1 poly(beta-D-mannuronate) lyase [Streptomyces netropsis]GGR52094.1 lyase [Streptomyces netropsis]
MKRRTFLTGTLLGAAGLAAVPVGASAATVTVSSLDGLQKAIDRAVPGDRIVVADGTYTVPAGGALRVSGKNGTGDAPITIVAASRGGAVLQGERGFVFSDSSNIVVSGFAFRQSSTLEIPANSSHIRLTRNDFKFADVSGMDWVVVRGDDVKIDRNRFHDRTTEGIFVVLDGRDAKTVAQNLTLFRNHFSGHSFTGANGGEAVRLGDSARALLSAKAVVEYNLFEKCDGDPEAISVKTSENTVRYNTIRNSRGGIVLRHGNRSTVEGNYLLGGAEGVRVYGNDHLVVNNYLGGLSGRALVIGSGTTRDHHPGESKEERRGNDACDRAVIVHNTLVGNAGTLSGEGRDYAPQDVVIADNLLVASAGSLVAMGKNTGFTWQGNILWGPASNGNIPSGGYRRVDPLLRQESDGVSRLSAGSPAIGAATLKSPSVTEDIDGHPRGRARDIGADQYTTLAPVRRPLTAADVGLNAS